MIRGSGVVAAFVLVFVVAAAPAARADVFESVDVPKVIPDLQSGGDVFSDLVIPDSMLISDMDVIIKQIDFEIMGKLRIILWSPHISQQFPNGLPMVLFDRRMGQGPPWADMIDTRFDDSATTQVSWGTAPWTGSYRPETPLSLVNGLDSQGTWRLEIQNQSMALSGTLVDWSIAIVPEPASLALLALGGVALLRRRG